MLRDRPLKVLGLMSGTSMDGVDAAVLETDGRRILGFGETAYRPYSEAERSVLRAALGHWDGPAVAAAEDIVTTAHIDLVHEIGMVDVVGFHGQTLSHDPGGRGTLQVGRGAELAARVGCPVVWDFRTRDVALGGQGAPLAPFYHFACAKWGNIDQPLVILNLGGVGNLTWIDPRAEAPEAPDALLAFDTGPANAPIDDLMHVSLGRPFDTHGQTAAKGRVDGESVAAFLQLPYFSEPPPKSLDRNSFETALTGIAARPVADAAATLTEICAASVARALEQLPSPPAEIWVTGGGRHNPTLMARLGALCDASVRSIETVGLDGDMLEAQAFAYLAARHVNDLPLSAPGTTGVAVVAKGGRLSVPDQSGQT
jgi:anhydro-N-acetylmuramic acid kinase